MKIVWSEQSIRWFQRASDYTGYSRELAKLLLEALPRGGTLCDMGCGSALIDYELAPRFREITCVDISDTVIRSVQEEVARRGIANITAVASDGRAVDGLWDAVIALFHDGSDLFERYFDKARDTLILATHSARIPCSEEDKCYDVPSTKQHLDSLGINYTVQEYALEYGQPLTDMEEARAFVRAYSSTDDAEQAAYLARALQPTGREDFPYYLPKTRRLGIFVIRKRDNPQYKV